MGIGAGLLIVREKDGKVLLVRRSELVTSPGGWAPPGGTVEHGETPIEAALREAEEELGPLPRLEIPMEEGYWVGDPFFAFGTFIAVLPGIGRWQPRLNEENDRWEWFDPGRLPRPLLPGVKEAVAALVGRAKKALLGEASSSRTFYACKGINLRVGTYMHLSFGMAVVDEIARSSALVTVVYHQGIPNLTGSAVCGQKTVEEAREHCKSFIRLDPQARVVEASGLDWNALRAFVSQDARMAGNAFITQLENWVMNALKACFP